MYGSVHTVAEQSSLGGGGGNVWSGGRGGILGVLEEKPRGVASGERTGIFVQPDTAVGEGEGAGEILVTGELRGGGAYCLCRLIGRNDSGMTGPLAGE